MDSDGFIDYPVETRILGAAKLSGKIDETWSIGVLSSLTERTYATIKDSTNKNLDVQVEPLSHYSVIRTQKEFNSGKQGLGLIFTSVNRDLNKYSLKNILSDQAYTVGVDGWTFLDDDEMYVINGSVIGSYVSGTKDYLINLQQEPYRYMQRPDKTYMPLDSNLTSISGYFSRIMLNKQKGDFYLNAAIGLVSPGFDYNDLGSQWMADRINGHLVLGYRWFEPDEIFRRKTLYIAYNRTSDYEDNISRSGFYATAGFQFLNYWGLNLNSSYNFKWVSTSLTRGGPKTDGPANYSINIAAYTDSREIIIVQPYASYWNNDIGSHESELGIDVEWKPTSQISLTLGPSVYNSYTINQWVGNFYDQTAINTYNFRYVFANLDYQTISANIRLSWIFTPTISLQLYVQPLLSVGDFYNFKELINPPTLDTKVYGNENSTITYDENNGIYEVDPDATGLANSFSFSNPDFNFKSLRGNLVLRWEVLPGSVFYFAWTNSRVNFDNAGKFNFNNDFSNLLRAETDNIFLIKFSYWLDM